MEVMVHTGMSTKDEQTRNGWFKGTLPGWATPILIGLVGFFGGSQLNDMKKEMAEIKVEMKEIRTAAQAKSEKLIEIETNQRYMGNQLNQLQSPKAAGAK